MAETFDTCSRRPLFSKIITFLIILFWPCIIVMLVQPQFLSTSFETYFIIIFFLSFTGFIIGLIGGALPSNLNYKKDGEITFNETSIIINLYHYNLTNLNKIEIRAKSYKGKGPKIGIDDGSGNRIKIYQNSNEVMDIHFVIESKTQLLNLEEIVQKWKVNGFKIIQTYFI